MLPIVHRQRQRVSVRRPVFGWSKKARQIDLDRRALAHLAVDLDMAAGLLDEAINLAEPKAGAARRLLVVKNGSNALAITSGAMPVPVSVTRYAHTVRRSRPDVSPHRSSSR